MDVVLSKDNLLFTLRSPKNRNVSIDLLEKKVHPPHDTNVNIFSVNGANSVIMTKEQRENAKKRLHTININEIEPFRRFFLPKQ